MAVENPRKAAAERQSAPEAEVSGNLAQRQGSVAEVTVIVLAYSLNRFAMDCAAVESALNQTVPPREVMLCVDDNADRPELLERFRARWPQRPGAAPSVRVVESESDADTLRASADQQEWRFHAHYGFRGTGISSGRTTCLALATTELVAFLDDDATADPDWLRRLLAPFADPHVVAVGGAPVPAYAKPPPRWFPAEYNWVFGCAYKGLPNTAGPALRLIGANMAVRRDDLRAIASLGSMEDMEICHRLLARSPRNVLIYEPRAIVHHRVHEDRLTWPYFWRRCYWANRDKVAIMKGLGGAANLKADRAYVLRTLPAGVLTGLRELLGGDIGGLQRAAAITAGLGIAAIAYAIGVLEWNLATWRRRGRTSSP
jgi:cellulose synthase/poly-beta-1,6-N-acetylglucosamine synthase-like glycosyltransferase